MSLLHTSADPLFAAELAASLRILAAAALGTLLGLERSISGKHAGMRTYALVAMGSAVFIVAGELLELLTYGTALDPSRIAAAIVMGIGFIGSGLALFHRSDDQPGEITTAAGVWVAAGVGMLAGFGFFLLASIATILAILIFSLLLRLENAFRSRYGKNGS